jgi:hypothetical protein
VTQVEDPGGVVFVHRFRDRDEQGRPGRAAQVFFGGSGESSHQWQQVGWVGEQPVQFNGLRFRLVYGPIESLAPDKTDVVLSLDRDVGVPVVFVGFAVISLGALLVLGAPRSRVVALVTEGGKGSDAMVRVSPAADQLQAERLWSQLESGLGAKRETGARRQV